MISFVIIKNFVNNTALLISHICLEIYAILPCNFEEIDKVKYSEDYEVSLQKKTIE